MTRYLPFIMCFISHHRKPSSDLLIVWKINSANKLKKSILG
jgi:hypothetical protein